MCDARLGLFKTDGLPARGFASAAPACLDVTAGTLGNSQFEKQKATFHFTLAIGDEEVKVPVLEIDRSRGEFTLQPGGNANDIDQ